MGLALGIGLILSMVLGQWLGESFLLTLSFFFSFPAPRVSVLNNVEALFG